MTNKVGKCLVAKNDSNPNIGFIGHTDTVDYHTWDGNPFELQQIDNKLVGLGACDMKGSIAAILSAVSKIDLTMNKMALYFTYDEETSFKGIEILKNEIFAKSIIVF